MPDPSTCRTQFLFAAPRPGGAWRLALWMACALGATSVAARDRGDALREVVLAASERVPYLGEGLPRKGYVAELAAAALQSQGWRVQFRFVPPARARLLAAQGEVDGYIPAAAVEEGALPPGMLSSQTFPGVTLGLLKKNTTALPAGLDLAGGLPAVVRSLGQRGVPLGVVRRDEPDNEFGVGPVDVAADDLQNIDKLDRDRVQMLLIDRYTAADLITGRRPQLIGKLDFVPGVSQARPFQVVFDVRKQGGRARLEAFNAGLNLMQRNDGLQRILARHGLQPAAPAGGGEVRLTIGTVDNADMLLMRELAREYEARNPRVKLQWRIMDEGTLRVRLLSDLAIADGQFDVVTVGAYEVPLWARRGWLLPLQPLPAHEQGDLFPSVRAGLTHEGRLYALPFYAESSMTYYRADLFAAAGLRMPAQPTWDDIAHAAQQLHRPGDGVYGVCLRGRAGWGENLALVGTMVNAYGGRWFDERWRAELTSPAWEAAVTMYASLLKNWGPPDAERNGYNENLRLFATGRCAIWVDATVAAGALYDPRRSQVADKVTAVAAPRAATARGSAWLWSWSLAVPHSSPRAAEAQAFIAWATSRGYIQAVARRHGWVAVPPGTRRSTYDSVEYRAVAPFSAVVQAALANAEGDAAALNRQYAGIQYVGIPEFPAIGGQVAAEVAKVLTGQQTVRQALQRAQVLTTSGMAAAGYAP